MKNKILKIKYIKHKACSRYYEKLIYSYFDESGKQNEIELNEHIKTCEKCNSLFSGIKLSNNITSSVRNEKNRNIDLLNEGLVNFNINKIMEKISKESENTITDKKTQKGYGFISWLSLKFTVENYKKAIIPLGSLAAVMVIFFFVNLLFGSQRNELDFLPNKSNIEGTDQLAGDNREKADFVDETSFEESSNNDYDRNYSDDLNRNPSNDATGEAGIRLILQNYFVNEATSELNEIIDMALNYYEVILENEYTGVFSFGNSDITFVKENLTGLFNENGITAEIKIIAGVNSEKLVEYIGRETIEEVFLENFTGDEDFLVILIGR